MFDDWVTWYHFKKPLGEIYQNLSTILSVNMKSQKHPEAPDLSLLAEIKMHYLCPYNYTRPEVKTDKKTEGLGNMSVIFMPSLKDLTLTLYPRFSSLYLCCFLA